MSATIDLVTRVNPSRQDVAGQVARLGDTAYSGRLPPGFSFVGSATLTSDYLLEGGFSGQIDAHDSVVCVDKNASLSGDLTSHHAVVAGAVTGSIDCIKGCVLFESTSVCDVSVCYLEMEVEQGASVNARMRRFAKAD